MWQTRQRIIHGVLRRTGRQSQKTDCDQPPPKNSTHPTFVKSYSPPPKPTPTNLSKPFVSSAPRKATFSPPSPAGTHSRPPPLSASICPTSSRATSHILSSTVARTKGLTEQEKQVLSNFRVHMEGRVAEGTMSQGSANLEHERLTEGVRESGLHYALLAPGATLPTAE